MASWGFLTRASLALAFTVPFAVCRPGAAAVYVVDQAAPGAADTNPGTEEKPFKTVQKAVSVAQAGDRVCVMEGNYSERVKMTVSGAQDRPITIQAAPQRQALVRGFEIGDVGFIRVEGFRILTGAPASRDPGVSIGKGAHDIEIIDNAIEDTYNAIEGAGKSIRIARNHIYKTQFGLLVHGAGWLIEHNNIERQFQHREGDCDYSRMWGQDHVIRFNRFHGTKRAEVGQAHLDIMQSFNVKKDNPGMFLHHVTFEYNACRDFSQGVMLSTSTPGTHHHFTYSRNVFFAGGSWGLNCKNMDAFVAEHNSFARIKWYGFGNAGGKGGRSTANLFSEIITPYTYGEGFTGSKNLIWEFQEKPKDGEPIEGDPKFADLEAGNLRLTAGSAAIDAGPDGADIGALEYPNVYYVDPAHPGASDEGFGYAGWPYKSAGKALATAQAGETIILRGGAYREALKPPRDGVTIRAMKGEKAVVSGADLVEGWRREEGGAWSAPLATEPKKVLRDGQPWSGFTYNKSAKRMTVKTSGDPRLHIFEAVVRAAGIDTAGRKDVKIEGIEVVDTLGGPTTGPAK